jgi:transcriptional regulator with XRE-family HTH domain
VPAKKGPGVDQSVVEQVKALRATNVPQRTVADQLGIHISTVRRYERRQDETPEQYEARAKELVRFAENAWEVVRLAVIEVIEGLRNKEIKPKDAAVIGGIYFDKILAAESRIGGNEKTTERFVLEVVTSESKSDSLPDPGEVSQLPSAVQSDDLRIGGGENVLGVLGSGDPESGTENVRGGGSFDLSEPQGLRDSDDNGGTLGSSGDS